MEEGDRNAIRRIRNTRKLPQFLFSKRVYTTANGSTPIQEPWSFYRKMAKDNHLDFYLQKGFAILPRFRCGRSKHRWL
jgi:hypothetical protein